MFAIVGAAGKVGYSTSRVLRNAGFPVRAILRDSTQAGRLSALGCDIARADLQDPVSLGQALENAHAVQVICPPVLRSQDCAGEMRRSIESVAEALERARPDLVLAISDYGAHVQEDIGMPSVFRVFEERLGRLPMRKVFLRSAEHMEAWGALIPTVAASGMLPSLHQPVEKALPSISAHDVGVIAGDLLLDPGEGPDARIVHVEGPRRYSPHDVATAMSQLLRRPVTAQAVPPWQWPAALARIVSASTAELLIALYEAHRRALIDVEPNRGEVRYGTTELLDALRRLRGSATA